MCPIDFLSQKRRSTVGVRQLRGEPRHGSSDRRRAGGRKVSKFFSTDKASNEVLFVWEAVCSKVKSFPEESPRALGEVGGLGGGPAR